MAFTIPKLAWPITFSAGVNDTFDISESGGGWLTVTIPAGTYFWRGDGSAADLVKVLDTALETAGAHSYTVDLGATGIVQIEDNTDAVNIDWSSGTIDAAIFGFTAAATGSASGHSGDFQVGRIWLPEQEIVEDQGDIPVYSTSRQRMSDGSMDTQRWAKHYVRDVLVDALPLRKTREASEVRAQEAWSSGGSDRPSDWWADGERFEFCPDFASSAGVLTNEDVYDTYKPREDTEPVLTPGTVDRYDLALPMIAYVA